MKKKIVKSEYDLQAEKFLSDTDSKIEIIYTGHRPYFQNDKEFRATFSVILIRNNKSMTFDFGNSISDSWTLFNGYKRLSSQHKEFNSSFVNKAIASGQEITFGYHMSLKKNSNNPSAYSILTCLEKYNPETFEDFCNNFGYDTDSRKVFDIYQKVQKQYSDLTRLYSESELELMAEIV